MEGLELSPITSGTPQGGVISPLLANIALHGIEHAANTSYIRRDKSGNRITPTLIRYADDFLVLCADLDGVEAAQAALDVWLADMGLHLSPTKTRISHTQHRIGATVGCDFLGFTIRNYPVGKYHAGSTKQGGKLGFKTFITPSKEAVKRHIATMGAVVKKNKGAPQEVLITDLNRATVGWTYYYRTVVANRVFKTCDHRLYAQLQSWARRRHPRKSRKWIAQRYWTMQPGAKWDFVATKDGQMVARLRPHAATQIQRHIKVKGSASPFDGNLLYWAQRLTDHPLTRGEESKLLKRQRGACTECHLYFRGDDVRAIDHIIPREWGGSDYLSNKQVLHRHCHDQKTARQRAQRHLS
jgi:RNA-directed DNA polymerase